jgi:transcription antitermination factor NusG
MAHEHSILTLKPAPVKNWMVIYTRSNWEKKASQLLTDHGFTSFCPVIKEKKKWADRYKLIETPLFKSYLFVYLTPSEQSKILQIPGIISFVKHCGSPVMIPKSEIDRIEIIISNYSNVEVVNFRVGDRIMINDGPFINYQGQVADVLGASILMVMEQLGCALVVKVNQSDVTHMTNNLFLVKSQ